MILITGATGRIAGALIPLLMEKDYRVRAVVLPGDGGLERIRQYGVDCVEGRLEDASMYPSLLEGVDAIFHLGALMFQDWVTNDALFKVNIEGTYNVLEAVALNRIALKKFVFASSDQVYPSLRANYSPIDEKHPTEPYCLYGLTKLVGEQLCRTYLDEYGVPTVWPRFTNTIRGEEYLIPEREYSSFFYVNAKLETLRKTPSPPDEIARLIEDLERIREKNGDAMFIPCDDSGNPHEMPLTDPRDVAQGLLLLLENENVAGEPFNFGPPYSVPFDKVVKYLSEKTGLPYAKVFVPTGSLRHNFKISIEKAKATLGFNPRWDIYKMIDELEL